MNKVVCNVCGTSYPENVAECPICGFARTTEKSYSSISADGTYTYVKGGRFSKANVKKRNTANGYTSKPASTGNQTPKSGKKRNLGAILLVIVLLFSILAVGGYILLRFFLPNDFLYEGLSKIRLPEQIIQKDNTDTIEEVEETTTEPETTISLSCTEIILDTNEVLLENPDSTYTLTVKTTPENTEDTVSFTSADDRIAEVNESGVIKAVGEGTTEITVSCGDITTKCTVICVFPTTEEDVEVLELNRKEITFNAEGQSWMLYDGIIPMEDIVWTSDDIDVASIFNGEVLAVGNGDTTVYAIYGEQTVSCIIHCDFIDDSEEDPDDDNGISAAGGDSKMVCFLYNPAGNAEDVTMNIDETFTLMLVDEFKNEITDAEWEVSDESVCSFENNTVTALQSGTAEIIATYDGLDYICIVRVN